jgi:AcrR family transcriptional regulator
MKVVKEEKVRQKKKVITDALRRCLNKDVYSRITVQEIADEAGFSKGGILHYFPTKEDIYLELIDSIFTELENTHIKIFEDGLKNVEVAPLSALVGVESFILDKNNIKIITNLMLYAFEEEKVKEKIKSFIVKHKMFYTGIIKNSRKEGPSRRKADLDPGAMARIVQTILLFIGILEFIDYTNIDHYDIVKFISTMIKS